MLCFSTSESVILLDLKSKTLSSLLLLKLTAITEAEARHHSKKPQILPVVRFLKKFLEENPLCVCYDEISNVKKVLNSKCELKLKQKNSKIILSIIEGEYFLKTKIKVPDDYFTKSIR